MIIELIYDRDCPNAPTARAQLSRALVQAGLPVRWQEWDRHATDSPPHVRAYGSPTILVNGKDGSGVAPSGDADCCRLYRSSGGRLAGVPEVDDIAEVLLKARKAGPTEQRSATARPAWNKVLAVLPAIGVALLPKLTCPAGWPAYAGMLSALGLGFVNYTPFLLPLTVLFLLVSVGSLVFAAQRHRRGEPLVLGIAAAATVVAGKFAWDSDTVMFGGLAILVGASLWNTWLARKTCCSAACDDRAGKKAVDSASRCRA
jgi:mercuric ion transport protein